MKNTNKERAQELRELAKQLLRHADEIDGSYIAAGGNLIAYEAASLDRLARLAKHNRQERIYRNSVFGAELFGEPAWDMLLYLFAKRVKGEPVLKMEATAAAHVSHSTGLRYVKLLDDRGLISTKRDVCDSRAQIVEITLDGVALMANCLSQQVRRASLGITQLGELARRPVEQIEPPLRARSASG